MVTLEQFVVDLNNLRPDLETNLVKYSKTNGFFEKRIRDRMKLDLWQYNPLISMILLDRHAHLEDLFDLPTGYNGILCSVKKTLPGSSSVGF